MKNSIDVAITLENENEKHTYLQIHTKVRKETI